MTEDEFRTGVSVGGDRIENIPPAFDYMAEADKTCSIVFNPHYVPRDDMVTVLKAIAGACEDLNLYKKLLFRGKRPEDLSLLAPLLSHSLAVEFDPNNSTASEINLLHGIVGVITEAGEMAEVLIRRIETGSFDRVNAIEETGDVSWYLVRILRGLGVDMTFMHKVNIDKLHGRQGEAFDVFRDANRDLAVERKRLETATAPLFDPGEYHDGERNRATAAPADYVSRGHHAALGMAEPVSPLQASEALQDAHAGASGTIDYGECLGSDVGHPPEPGLIWTDGCWRREFVRDVPGLAV